MARAAYSVRSGGSVGGGGRGRGGSTRGGEEEGSYTVAESEEAVEGHVVDHSVWVVQGEEEGQVFDLEHPLFLSIDDYHDDHDTTHYTNNSIFFISIGPSHNKQQLYFYELSQQHSPSSSSAMYFYQHFFWIFTPYTLFRSSFTGHSILHAHHAFTLSFYMRSPFLAYAFRLPSSLSPTIVFISTTLIAR